MSEIWKPIKGYEGFYEVSNLGNVRIVERRVRFGNQFRTVKPKNLKPNDNGKGYKYYSLRVNGGKVKHVYAHRVVAEVFLCNCFDLPEVNHIDGNKSNNCVDNLEWCTRSENLVHAHRTGLNYSLKGEANPQAKLTTEKVLKVRELFATGNYMQITLADMFGISRGYIHAIIHRTKWKHI